MSGRGHYAFGQDARVLVDELEAEPAPAVVVQSGHPRGAPHTPPGPVPAAAWAAAHAAR